MSTLQTFIVYAPDVDAPDTFQRRLSTRPAHLENAVRLHHNGSIVYGGAMLSPESVASPTAEKKLIGSVIVYAAESLEAVRAIVESDLYYTEKVWDKEKLVILPFAQASFPKTQ
ncbi:hypothetical protein B0H21DRAFT_145187 [Amylocystis lapponica]|nr:hypothetical protein B0H21DRAFT_145187 [Amylocystis lapponica]